jgi:diaminopimelate epimerase
MTAIPCRFVSAAGNRFALIDALDAPPPADPARLARALRDPAAWEGAGPPRPLDGLLLVRPPRTGDADCVLEIYNLDGGRPEACGNGLRCVARHVHERGRAGARVRVATDAGPRAVDVDQKGPEVVTRAWMGLPRLTAERVELRLGHGLAADAPGEPLAGVAVALGNPHCVVLVPDERPLPLAAWGTLLQRDPRFPRGVNLELVSLREPERLAARVFERGVGETGSCGTGACAAAFVADRLGLRSLPARVAMRGGELLVDRAPDGGLRLAGPVHDEGEGRLAAPSAVGAPR